MASVQLLSAIVLYWFIYIIKTDKIHVVLRHVKQGVFVLLSVVYMHLFKWLQVWVVGRLVSDLI